MSVNVWGQVGAVTGFLPMSALTGAAGQLLGMDVSATIAEWKAATFLSNQLAVPAAGVPASPNYTFTSDLDTGFYQDGANAIGVAVGGNKVAQFAAGALTLSANLSMNQKIISEAKSADIVATANIELAAADGNYVYITNAAGDVNITRLGGATLQKGTSFELKFVVIGGSVTLINDPNFLAILGGSDITVANGDIVRIRKTNSFDQFWEVVSYTKGSSVQIVAAAAAPLTYILPEPDDRPAMVAGGWLPWNLNQQWGGAGCMPMHMIDAATDVEYKFDMLDGYIDNDLVLDTTSCSVGTTVNNVNRYQAITPAKNTTIVAVWLRLIKNGNPTDNITAQIWSVAAGIPSALLSTSSSLNAKQISSDSSGNWYRFVFPVPQAVVAGTQYIINIIRSGAIDVTNFYSWAAKALSPSRYPNNLHGTGTAAFAWTAANTTSNAFICEVPATDQPIQTAGTFSGRIVGNEGTPINRSVAWNKPLREFFPLFNPAGWSISIRGKSWTKDRTICDLIYGIHHDRINIRCLAGTGLPVVTVYKTDGTVITTTGLSDISSGAFKDLMIVGRSVGDGNDYIRIYVGIAGVWSKEGENTAQTLTFDPLMLKQGTAWIMGGFQLFKAADFTKLSDMSVLPSADGWTFTGTAVEGNVFAISNGKLNQIKSGYAAADTGFYRKAALALSNANGWFTAHKRRIGTNTNTKTVRTVDFAVSDGVKTCELLVQEYFTEFWDGAASQFQTQAENKIADTVEIFTGKGSDALHFQNGRLLCDATSRMITASANNQIDFGDNAAAAGENADVSWDYVGYYNTSNIYPQFTSGELHEFGVWIGDQNALGQAIYSAGNPISIKQFCGIAANFIGINSLQKYKNVGITAQPTTGVATRLVAPEMEQFFIGNIFSSSFSTTSQGSAINIVCETMAFLDGAFLPGTLIQPQSYGSGANMMNSFSVLGYDKLFFGLHKLDVRYSDASASGTVTLTQQTRGLFTEARVNT